MMSYNFPPDPGKVFKSDVHRRVLAVVWLEGSTLDEIQERVDLDPYSPVEGDETVDVLKDLESTGDVTNDGDTWTRTTLGHAALTSE